MDHSSIKELRTFLLLWVSQTVSQLGTAMTDYAVVIWVYGEKGTASSVTLLTLCIFLPTIFFRFIAGGFVDRWNKKRVMLVADFVAALGTLTILLLYSCDSLAIWQIYLINFLLSFMNAFQQPASFVATSMLVPKEHYTRVNGLQSFGGAAVSILAPALGSLLLAYGGLKVVLYCDLASFAVAFLVLLFFIKIPEVEHKKEENEPFMKASLAGLKFLKEHTAILRLTLFLTAVNFLAKLGGDGMLSPFILGRTNNNQPILGMVESAVAIGLLVGSLIVTIMKPVKKRTKLIFITTAIVFSGNIVQSMTTLPWLWCAAGFYSYFMAVIMNANLMGIMREKVPLELQGRVFAADDTLKNCSIPVAIFLSGILADHVFEPFMNSTSAVQRFLSGIVGSGKGSGIGLMFLIVGIAGIVMSLLQLRKSVYRELDLTEEN